MAEITPKEIVIKRKNFDDAMIPIRKYEEGADFKRQSLDEVMQSIDVYANSAKDSESIDKVPENGGFLGKGEYKVKGREFNKVISQIDSNIVNLKNFNLDTIDIITDICKALAALDKEYILKIFSAAYTALEASNKAQSAIDEANKNIEAINKLIESFKNFKESLEKIKHLKDIDKAYAALEEHKIVIKTLCDHKNKMSLLKHIDDIDQLWEEAMACSKHISDVEEALLRMKDIQDEKLDEMASKQQDALSAFSEEQNKKFDLTNSEIRSEKDTLNEQSLILTQKIKIAYIIAGGSAAFSIIHIILNALGVI